MFLTHKLKQSKIVRLLEDSYVNIKVLTTSIIFISLCNKMSPKIYLVKKYKKKEMIQKDSAGV